MIRKASCVVAMTGAGASTNAGIPDFRGPNGIYASGRYSQRVFDIEQFRRDPGEFFRFTRDLFTAIGHIAPTPSHRLLADWEARGLIAGVITQNIDPLHALAGSRNVLAVHGSYALAHCQSCGREFAYEQFARMVFEADVPRCPCSARSVIKPDVVFFGEAVRDFEAAHALACRCDLMLVLGSSLAVQPAALLPQLVNGDVVIVNRGESALPKSPRRHFVQAEVDAFMAAVEERL
ncbi:MAG: hypothetical protein LLG01_05345 [Planctomycetaceae bacterium]|nr:hypothetical protein [Planctomycetaceae bacterium]